jgi:hypothetical protein
MVCLRIISVDTLHKGDTDDDDDDDDDNNNNNNNMQQGCTKLKKKSSGHIRHLDTRKTT